jgi:hypothetical protein
MRPDPGRASDDNKLTGFGCFGPSDKVFDWIVFCRLDQCSRVSYVDDNSCLISE